MKTFAVSVLVLAIIGLSASQLTEEQQKKIRENREECIKETKVEPELIDRADQGDFTDDEKLKCFAKCFYQRAGFLNDKGEVLLDVVKAKIPETNKEEALAIIEKCQEQKGTDPCDNAYKIHKCYFENTHRQSRPETQPEESKPQNQKSDEKTKA